MKKQTVVGVIVMIAAILISIPLGVTRSFARMRKELVTAFYSDRTGYSISDGLSARMVTARNAVTLASRYADSAPQLKEPIGEVDHAIDLCSPALAKNMKNLEELVMANHQLTQAAQELCEQLENAGLSEKDAKYPRQFLADLDAEQDKLERSGFNDKVIEYNRTLTGSLFYPACGLLGIRQLVPFGTGSDYVQLKVQ